MEDKTSKICIDTSVIIKLITEESDSNKADFLARQISNQGYQIIAPDYLNVEIYSVIRKKVHFKKTTSTKAHKSLELFNKLNIFYHPNSFLLNPAYQLAQKLHLPVIYDCLFLALAQKYKIPFVTADLQFLKKAKTVHKKSYSLTEFPELIS